MRNKLDLLDARILEALGEYGPRNITEVARKLNVPRGTVLTRIKRLSSLFYLRLITNVYHTNLGLKKGVVFAKATPGNEELLLNSMKINKFYIYVGRCYGMFEGCLGIYVIPRDETRRFGQFIKEIRRLGPAQSVKLFWSTCFHTVNRTTNWFDGASGNWILQWDKWIEEVQNEKKELPYTLRDPDIFPLKADETDLLIIKELEKNAAIDLIDIAKKLGTTLQNIHHHYKMHVIQRGLVEAYQIGILPFDRTVSDMYFFILKFDDYEKLAKFARSLLDKPFVYIVGKILEQNALITQFYLPRSEFRNFVDSLSKLARLGYLQSYDYIIQDSRQGRWSRETIPYQFFKDGAWTYDHDGHVKSLRDLIEQAGKEKESARQSAA